MYLIQNLILDTRSCRHRMQEKVIDTVAMGCQLLTYYSGVFFFLLEF